MTFRQLATKTARIVIAVGVFVMTLEIAARLDDWITWNAPIWSHYGHDELRTADSLGFHNRPHAQFEKWKINSHGFRGPEITIEKPVGVTRVMVVGASEAFGLYESEQMEFPAQLQQQLEAAQPGRFQVVNAACPGMTPPRIARFYEQWLRRFEPDVIIYYPTPVFYLRSDPPEEEVNLEQVKNWKPRRSWRIRAKVNIVLKKWVPRSFQTRFRQYRKEQRLQEHGRGNFFPSPPSERLQLMADHVSDLISTVRSDAVGFILANHVSRFRGPPDDEDLFHLTGLCQDFPRATSETLISLDRNASRVLGDLANTLDVPVVALDHVVPQDSDHFADAIHFTDQGATVVAQALAAEVLRHYGGPSPRQL